jgi:hypothetical protein
MLDSIQYNLFILYKRIMSIRQLRLEYELARMNKLALAQLNPLSAENVALNANSQGNKKVPALVIDDEYKQPFGPPQDFIQGDAQDYISPADRVNYEMNRIDARRVFRNRLLTLANPVTAERILNDPRLNDDEILKLNSIWTRFVADMKAQYNNINADTLLDFADTYLYKVRTKEEGQLTNNDVAESRFQGQMTIDDREYAVLKSKGQNRLFDVQADKVIGYREYNTAVPAGVRSKLGVGVTAACQYVIAHNGENEYSDIKEGDTNAAITEDDFQTIFGDSANVYNSPHTPHKPAAPKPSKQGPKSKGTNSSSSSSAANVDEAYQTPKGKAPKADSKGFTPANRIRADEIPEMNQKLMQTDKQYAVVYGLLETLNGEPEDRKLKSAEIAHVNKRLSEVGLRVLPKKVTNYRKLYEELAPFIRDRHQHFEGNGLVKGKGNPKAKPKAKPINVASAKPIKTIQAGKKKITIFGSGFVGEKGIQTTEASTTYQPFGKFIINTKLLLDDNKLRLLYAKTYQNILTFKTTLISNDYREILLDLIDHKKFNQRLYDLLDEKERTHLNLLLNRSGVRVALKIKINSDTEYELKKKKWVVIQGEINAGNDSKLLKEEAKGLLDYFKTKKTITKSEYETAMKQLE